MASGMVSKSRAPLLVAMADGGSGLRCCRVPPSLLLPGDPAQWMSRSRCDVSWERGCVCSKVNSRRQTQSHGGRNSLDNGFEWADVQGVDGSMVDGFECARVEGIWPKIP